MNRKTLSLLLIFGVLLVDQVLKIWVKTTMYIGQEIFVIGEWFRLHFTENEGMAFGFTLGGQYGKLVLSLFRIFAVVFIGYYLVHSVSKKSPKGLIASFSLIFAGAMGNIIDSVIYGVIFTTSHGQLSSFSPGNGYGTLFHGKVVDMLYFPIYDGILPGWIPFWGDTYMIFFRPVFNVADAAITAGVFMIILFQRRYFKEDGEEPLSEATPNAIPTEENPPVSA